MILTSNILTLILNHFYRAEFSHKQGTRSGWHLSSA